MLYQRILTAIPLAAFVIWMIFFQPSSVFLYLLLVVVLISAYEWAKLSGVHDVFIRCIYSSLLTSMTFAVMQYASEYVIWLIYLSVLWWAGVAWYLKNAVPKQAAASLKPDKLIIAFIVLPAAAYAMQTIHSMEQGSEWLFYALSLVWIADIGAYFSGKNFGKNKLAVHISPGKTVEGLIGALVATSLYTLLAGYYFELSMASVASLLLLSIIITLISVTGDLYISFLKREAGMKDSGNILPGHGGILDRIDSVLAAMPVFLVGFKILVAA